MPVHRSSYTPIDLAAAAFAFMAVLSACGGRTADFFGDGGPTLGSADGATSSGSGGGGPEAAAPAFPYSGPSCVSSNIPPGCWSCITTTCPDVVSCITNECSSYFQCSCACAAGDTGCQSFDCSREMDGTCSSCLETTGWCNACASQCVKPVMTVGEITKCPGFPSGCTGGFVSCYWGGVGTVNVESVSTDGGPPCTTYIQAQVLDGPMFPCASCDDQTECIQQATMAACL